MGFPPIKYCILCESVRPEIGGKLTILGFYGILPDVEIQLQNFEGPIPFTFIFGTGPSGGKFNVSSEILDSGDSKVIEAPPIDIIFESKNKRTFLILNIQAVIFKQSGEYTFRLLADNREVYRATFSIIAPAPAVQPA